MNRNHYTTSSVFSKALSLILAVLLCFGAYHLGISLMDARADEVTTKAWVICKPTDYINLRMWPSKKATEAGRLDPGDWVEIDGKTKSGFAHIVSPADAWIWAGYLVFDEPKAVNETYVVVAKNRVACRRWCDGPQVESRPWLVNGSSVKVYYESREWCCTARGFVRTEWLEVDPQ